MMKLKTMHFVLEKTILALKLFGARAKVYDLQKFQTIPQAIEHLLNKILKMIEKL